MKKLLFKICVLSFLFVLTSCIYESPVPIDKASVKTDSRLCAKWEEQGSKDIYVVKKFDEFNYKIEMFSQQSKKTSDMSAYSSMIDGVCFLNIKDLNKQNPSKNYMIVKLEWADDNNFKIYPLNENTKEQFNTSDELRKFIQSKMKDSTFYGQPGLFKRIR